MKKAMILVVLFTFVLAGCSTGSSSKSDQIELEFYFPVAVGGPITTIIDDLVADFHEQHGNIKVTPIFAGSYSETMTKVLTAVQGNNSPDLAVLFSIDLHTLLSLEAIEKLNPYFESSYLDDFFEGFMSNSQVGDDVWSIPFQRSTIVLYYNKDAFREAGLDPEKPPANWDELVEYSKQLTANGRWGLEIPSTGYQYWMFQALALQASGGQNIMSDDGTEVYFDTKENLEALQFYVDLGREHKVMPEGIIEWATVPSDFISEKTAMMFHTTGNLTRVKDEANFDFGVAYLPAKKDYGTPTGGGNIYMFKNIPEENKEAAVTFIEFLTEPERVAQWSMDTGYVATRQSAYETEKLQSYIAEFPEAKVALDQLEYGDSELSTFENGRVQKILNDSIQSALTGNISAEEALKRAQKEADEVLKGYKK